MDACTFCKIYKEREGTIYENESFYSKLDKAPVSNGHSLVISKKHIVSFLELDDYDWRNLKDALKETVKLIESKYEKRPDGYNFGVNDGRAAGRTIDHLHVHIIPRYFGDEENPVGGVRNLMSKKIPPSSN